MVIMKTVCLFIGDITRCGGTERMTSLLANELVNHTPYRVLILSLTERSQTAFFGLDPRVFRFALYKKDHHYRLMLPFTRRRLASFLRKQQVDVLIDVDVILSTASAAAVNKVKCKWIAWEHFHFYENLGVPLRDRGRTHAKQYADAIVTLTKADALQYQETPVRGSVVPIYNALIPHTPSDSGSPEDKPFILSVGRLDHQKGFDRIPAMAEHILARFPEYNWIILGEGRYRRLIEEELRRRDLADRVKLPGRCDPYDYYKHASLLVMPSRYEGFGLVLLEAMSEGCPAVAFDCKIGPSEMIRDGENGYLAPAEDIPAMEEKILALLNDPELRRTFADNAKKISTEFSVQTFTEKWIDCINGVLK